MKILIINNCNEEHPNLYKFLKRFGHVEEIYFHQIESIYKIDKNYDLIVLSGSRYRQLSGNENLYRKEMELIKKSKTPIIGICFGFELILKTYKEKIYFSRDKVSGLSKIIFNSKVFKVWQNHFWVAKKLKLNSKLIPLSDSKNGIEIVKVKRRNIYGLQFHPEHVDHPNDGLVIFKYILTTIFS